MIFDKMREYWPIILFIGTVVFSYAQMEEKLDAITVQIETNNSALYKYVDNKISNQDEKIANISQYNQFLHQQLVETNDRLNSNIQSLTDVSKQINERVDKIWSAMSNNAKR